jgi:UDP-N-acetylmuramyl tripeptide synthase
MPIPRVIFKEIEMAQKDKIITILKDDPNHAYSCMELHDILYPMKNKTLIDLIDRVNNIKNVFTLLDSMEKDSILISKKIDGQLYYMLKE